MNYLLVGSDTREGLTKAELKELRVGSVATAAGKRSDTMLLVHISKARDKAIIISIPRDSFALIPQHTKPSGKVSPAVHSKINSSFNWGGAPLLIQTLEEMTQLKIDHYIEMNFVGFARVVDSLGGIEVCTKKDIDDPKSHLVLEAGAEEVNDLGEAFEIVSEPVDLVPVRTALQTAGIDYESADSSFLPSMSIPLDADGAKKVFELIDAIEELDDVQNVYSNFDVSDEVMASLE